MNQEPANSIQGHRDSDSTTSATVSTRSKRNGGHGEDPALKTVAREADRLRRKLSHAEEALERAQNSGSASNLAKQRARVASVKAEYDKAERQHILYCGVRSWYFEHLGYDAYFTRLLPQGYNDPKQVVAHFWDGQKIEVSYHGHDNRLCYHRFDLRFGMR